MNEKRIALITLIITETLIIVFMLICLWVTSHRIQQDFLELEMKFTPIMEARIQAIDNNATNELARLQKITSVLFIESVNFKEQFEKHRHKGIYGEIK